MTTYEELIAQRAELDRQIEAARRAEQGRSHQSIKAALIDAENKVVEASGLGERAKIQSVPKKGNPH